MAKYAVAKAADIPDGQRKLFQIDGRAIVIFNLQGEYFAMNNRCPHQGASLCNGYLSGVISSTQPGEYVFEREGEVIRCPWHGWEFDIRTGESAFDPLDTTVKMYEAHVSLGNELSEQSYKAETFPVALEEEYIVVEI